MRYIIDFENSSSQEDIDFYLASQGCTVVREFDNFEKTYVVDAATFPVEGGIVESVVEDNAAEMDLQEVEMRSFETDAEDNWWKLAVLSGIDLEQAEVQYRVGGDNVRVYVLDSGIKADHVEFAGKDVTLLHSVVEGDFTDSTGHGTALASVLVGETCGITNAALKVVKIFHQGHQTLVSDLLAAFDAVMTDYVAHADYLAVMNLSWAISKNEYVESKIQSLIDLGLFAVVSAGNSGQPISNVTPASMAEAITVGSFGQDLKASDFSDYTGPLDTSLTGGATNYGGLDLFAPGEGIRVAKINGEYGYTAGTSIAAAICSAIAALNIGSSGYTWNFTQHENTADEVIRTICVKDILTLEGNYASSPNLVCTASRTRLTDRKATGRFIVTSEEDFALHLFSADFYKSAALTEAPEWMVLSGNFMTGLAPATDNVLYATGKLTLVNLLDEVEEQTINFIVHRPDMERAEMHQQVQIEFNVYWPNGSCDDFCTYSCCTCCGGDKSSGGFCQDCYSPTNGCMDTVCV